MGTELENQIADLKKQVNQLKEGTKDQLSMVVFSGDMDKILAAMIIATGAAASVRPTAPRFPPAV